MRMRSPSSARRCDGASDHGDNCDAPLRELTQQAIQHSSVRLDLPAPPVPVTPITGTAGDGRASFARSCPRSPDSPPALRGVKSRDRSTDHRCGGRQASTAGFAASGCGGASSRFMPSRPSACRRPGCRSFNAVRLERLDFVRCDRAAAADDDSNGAASCSRSMSIM